MTHLNNEIALTIKLEGEAFTSWDGIAEEVTRTIADRLMSDHTLKLRDHVLEIINDRVAEVVGAKVEALLSKPVLPVTRYGEPIEGAVAKTLADMVADAADAALTETVDPHNGKPEKRNQYNGAIPRLQWLVGKVAREGIASEIEKSVKAVNAEARAAVQKQVAAEIAARLAKG
jgi:hypothetical protein